MDRITPKKSLGQHWLYDELSLQAMCDYGEVSEEDYVVEVGPGLGTLTSKLLETGAFVHAVEFDQDLARKLPKALLEVRPLADLQDKLKVVNQDILGFNFAEMPTDYKVVANIPYYLTSNLIRVLSESSNRPSIVVLLIQKEVAERLCAEPGNMSLLSIWAQIYFECSLGVEVPAELFTPPPKVDSQIVILRRLDIPLFNDNDKKLFSRLVRSGFGNKRKTLQNSLSNGLALPKSQIEKLLIDSDLNITTRPQELSLYQWGKLLANYRLMIS